MHTILNHIIAVTKHWVSVWHYPRSRSMR